MLVDALNLLRQTNHLDNIKQRVDKLESKNMAAVNRFMKQ